MGFPTRGDACLDNCITNRVDLFGKAYPIHMLMKTDHKGVVLPAGTKLKPVRSKVYVRDCREHRKQALYRALAAEEWTDVKTADNINTAVDLLEHKIRTAIDKCLPRRSTRMSSRDPPWMTPLLRTMLRVKSRISPITLDHLKLINCRIAEVICQNRRSSTARLCGIVRAGNYTSLEPVLGNTHVAGLLGKGPTSVPYPRSTSP